MKKSILAVVVSIVMLMVFSGMAMAAGENVQLQFNGKNLTKHVPAVVTMGRTLVPLDAVGQILGADVKYDQAAQKVTIAKNDSTIEMTINSKAMYKNGQKVAELPVPAQVVNGRTMVPVRFVAEALGAKVDWNGAAQTVLLSFSEKRDGMTPEELMLKSNEAMMKYNTYKFNGTAAIKMSLAGTEQKLDTTMTIDGSCRRTSDKAEVYVKEVIDVPGMGTVPQSSISIEMYMDGSKMYQNLNGTGWNEMPLQFDMSELTKYQDPQSAIQMMKEFGLILSHGNKVNIAGKDYYTMVVTIDSEKYKKFVQEVALKTVRSTQENIDQKAIADLVNGMDINMSEKIIIDQETYLVTQARMEGQLSMAVGGQKVAQDINMTWNMTDYGKEVTMPDVSKK